ncbi:Gfo/Idh/MocA family protein [Hydrogenophaga taeniospiralis]|uniref:Gfo/Idh/MocA family protein n=1 Tax=Hydrogenophaga taeniospiralis TaxID=65656 RepID=UPI001CFA1311|nr:Gfo/Idh/MocA family oxidoreductase [Hydrogenophaga taeniospiralis]UCU94180.1 Gfo/Idh/MocA family oxidoreductase [Hydrogenophaga taeniospiralis]
MKIAIVGCGFVFDIYMRTLGGYPEIQICGVFDLNVERSSAVSSYYGFSVYDSYDELLSDKAVQVVVNLTNISAHYEVSKRALLAGKHVYSEKPLTKSLNESKELFEIAKSRRLILSGAPCNLFGDSMRTLIAAVQNGRIGKPLLVYAELDDNPIHLMEFEKVRSPTGAPWPVQEEIIEGCTYEHVGYHLVWLCAAFGPVVSLTSFSKELIENKCLDLAPFVGTPDFSVACLNFSSGVTARVTCSVVAPRDHRIQIVGTTGALYSEGYRRFDSPVYLENFSTRSLTARKFSLLERHPQIGALFGIKGKIIHSINHHKSSALHSPSAAKQGIKSKVLEWIRRRQIYAQDKLLGIWEMRESVNNGCDCSLSPEFLLHINELTILIQGAGPSGSSCRPETTFSLESISK